MYKIKYKSYKSTIRHVERVFRVFYLQYRFFTSLHYFSMTKTTNPFRTDYFITYLTFDLQFLRTVRLHYFLVKSIRKQLVLFYR